MVAYSVQEVYYFIMDCNNDLKIEGHYSHFHEMVYRPSQYKAFVCRLALDAYIERDE